VCIPRVSIAEFMALVGLVAVDCRAIVAFVPGQDLTVGLILLGGLPMVNALAIGLLLLRRRSPRQEPRHFLLGFEVAGAIALFLVVASSVVFPLPLAMHLNSVFRTVGLLHTMIGSDVGQPVRDVIEYTLVMIYVAFPQLILALIGGWVAHRVPISTLWVPLDSTRTITS
jgi:amino acid transporter